MDPNYYYCKCSICFENDSEMEFINCGDQFCFTCLERYVEYWIKEGSWGLLPADLICPVCGVEMLEDDWMPYISGRTIDLWHKFQVKRNESIRKLSIVRPCPLCNHPQSIKGNGGNSNSNLNSLSDFLVIGTQIGEYLDSIDFLENWREIFDLETVLDLMKTTESSADCSIFCQELFADFLNLLERLKCLNLLGSDRKDLIKLFIQFGRMFLVFFSDSVAIYEAAEGGYHDEIEGLCTLIDMELNFQMIFPFSICDICNLEFCLPCQQADWFHSRHPQTSCSTRPDGSKQCPRCFVAIEKEPDGCNEMRCNYCGIKFCWECGRKWSQDCGIYKCTISQSEAKEKSTNEQPLINEIPRSEIDFITTTGYSSRDPEIGVPNVLAIHQSKNRRN